MKIEMHQISLREIAEDYTNNNEEGVSGYAGQLNIRPKYQREFVYKPAQRDAVIDTVRHGFPLNSMYWVKTSTGYEILDGQQRTISVCEYITGKFSVGFQYFFNLTDDEKNQILDYEVTVYFCEGTDSEKLAWFRTINISGEKLTEQELRNAVYTGEWLTDAKKHFSKTGCAADGLGGAYLSGSPIRQDYLQTVLSWIAARDGCDSIETYMAQHQNDKNANAIWLYFQKVIAWVEAVFPHKRREMQGLPWGLMYNANKDREDLDPKELESSIVKLMEDEEVTKKSGIYEYVLDGEKKHLSLRSFPDRQKREAYERQDGICPICHQRFDIKEMQADHITPWSKGGRTTTENCQMLCADCNRRKSDI